MQRSSVPVVVAKTDKFAVERGDCLAVLRSMPNESVDLVITSPPYNIGKVYEKEKVMTLAKYLEWQAEIIRECARVVRPSGSICWQVGNYLDKSGDESAIVPLDCVLYQHFMDAKLRLRNRVVWHFEHGKNPSKRFAGRYETVNWFTKSDDYRFDVDPVRVPQKYPGKTGTKGKKRGKPTCNPLGKCPGDVWIIPNVKSNHVEKTSHPCQFPVELAERLVLALSRPGDVVFDPFAGVGSTMVAAVRHGRYGHGAEIRGDYCRTAVRRLREAVEGKLKVRAMGTPVFDPKNAGKKLLIKPWEVLAVPAQPAGEPQALAS